MSTLRVCTWNLRKTSYHNKAVWSIIKDIKADLLCLQEVNSFPIALENEYFILSKNAMSKNGNEQTFNTMILAKGDASEIQLCSNLNSVNDALSLFSGNLVSCKVKLWSGGLFNVLSVYSPAWPLDNWITKKDKAIIKLINNSKVWLTEILWDSLKHTYNNNPWIIAGDLNASTTFDYSQKMPRGNQEIIDRLYNLGFIECLFNFNKKLVPTFQNPKGKKVIHQIDHLFVSNSLYEYLINCKVLDDIKIFENSISDHLPIVADFKM